MGGCLCVFRVKLRIKTDCQQFELKDENFNEEASNIDLEPVTIPSEENSLKDSSTQQQQEEAGKRVVSITLRYKNLKVRLGSGFFFIFCKAKTKIHTN